MLLVRSLLFLFLYQTNGQHGINGTDGTPSTAPNGTNGSNGSNGSNSSTHTCTDVAGWEVSPYKYTCATVVANGLCFDDGNNLGFDGTRAPQSCCGCGGGTTTSPPPPGTLSTADQVQIDAIANHKTWR